MSVSGSGRFWWHGDGVCSGMQRTFEGGCVLMDSPISLGGAESTVTITGAELQSDGSSVPLTIESGGVATVTGAVFRSTGADITAVSVAEGGSLNVRESQLIKVDGSADPFPCDGTLPNCAGEHDGSVVVEGRATITLASPLVCNVETGECLADVCLARGDVCTEPTEFWPAGSICVHGRCSFAGGGVLAFGGNCCGCCTPSFGQLGDGSTEFRFSPVEAALGGDNAQVVVGAWHSLVLKADGRVMGFGKNDEGLLGDGTQTDRPSPVEITSLGMDNTQVAANEYHSLVLKTDGRVMAFGGNQWGQLGVDKSRQLHATIPVEVTALGDDNAPVAAGSGYSLVLKTDGRVMAFGANGYGQLGDGTRVGDGCHFDPIEVTGLGSDNAQVVASESHSLVLKVDGRVAGMGRNDHGQLGDSTTTDQHSPVEATALGNGNTQVTAGGAGFSLVLKSDGSVWGVGQNSHGELGDGSIIDRPSPIKVSALGDDNAQLAAGGSQAFVLKTDGRVFAFGENIYYQFGDGPNLDEPQRGTGTNHNGQPPLELTWLGSDNAQLAACSMHTLVLKVASWQSPCANVDCGDGSCVANFAVGMEPAVCSGWRLGNAGESCYAVCSGVGLGCTDGDWGVTDEASFRAALAAAGEDWDSTCSGGVCTPPVCSNTWDGAPDASNLYGCRWRPAGATRCSTTGAIQRRLCLCE
eukprot:SAG11_NODE_773_length_7236_cov_4.526412_1_plen_695_part_00